MFPVPVFLEQSKERTDCSALVAVFCPATRAQSQGPIRPELSTKQPRSPLTDLQRLVDSLMSRRLFQLT